MSISIDKARRMERIARLYYERGLTQDEIAQDLKVSRPLISRLLNEAREVGIVEVRVHSMANGKCVVLSRAREVFKLKGGIMLPDGVDGTTTNRLLAQSTLDLIQQVGGGRIGLGWGHMIGVIVRLLEERPPEQISITDVCPLVGNGNISVRNYHSNENVRIVAHQSLAIPHYLHAPAFTSNKREMELQQSTENYRAVCRQWEMLDVALVNIGNHPSTPDFASFARYGPLLASRQAMGRLIAYYYDAQGQIIHSDTDYAIQIPIRLLKKSRHVIGLCSANVNRRSLAGALRTGIFTHLVAREELLREVLDDCKMLNI